MSKLANKIAGERERERSRFTPRPPRSRNAKPLDDGDRSARLIASTAATSFRPKGRPVLRRLLLRLRLGRLRHDRRLRRALDRGQATGREGIDASARTG